MDFTEIDKLLKDIPEGTEKDFLKSTISDLKGKKEVKSSDFVSGLSSIMGNDGKATIDKLKDLDSALSKGFSDMLQNIKS